MRTVLFSLVASGMLALGAVSGVGAQSSADNTQVMAASSAQQGVGDAHGTGAGRTSAGLVHFEVSAHQRAVNDFGQVGVTVSTLTQ